MAYHASYCALLVLCALSSPGLLGQDAVPRSSGRPAAKAAVASRDRIALLVGVADYPEEMLNGPEGFSRLTGPRNDIALVRDLLISRFGFAKQNVKTLVDAEATHEAIVRAFDEWLIRRAGPDTQVVFWFSGHGSRIPDKSGLETKKEALAASSDTSYITYDSRTKGRSGSYDFSDDEMHSLLRALADKTPYALVVTDSCYSGGGTRGAADEGVKSKAFPRGTAPFEFDAVKAFWPKGVRFLDDDDPERFGRPVPCVHIAACADYEMAFEKRYTTNGKPTAYGMLTWSLSDVLERAKPGATIRQVAIEASAQISALGFRQTVWWEGNVDRKLFEARFDEPSSDYQAYCYSDLIQLSAGRVHGLSGDAVFRMMTLDRKLIGKARASTVGDVTSFLRWQGQNDNAKTYRHKALLARLEGPPSTHEPLHVKVDDKKLGATVKASPWARLAGKKGWDYRLERGKNELRLVTRDGLVARRVTLGKGLETRLQRALVKEHRFRSLWEFTTAHPEFDLRVRFVAPTETEAANLRQPRVAALAPAIDRESKKVDPTKLDDLSGCFPLECRVRVPPFQGAKGDKGSLAMLEVWNLSEEDLHVVVLSLGQNREVHVLYPNEGARDNVIRAKHSRLVAVSLGSDPDWKRDTAMIERYLAVGTRNYAGFSPFESSPVAQGSSRGDAGELPRRLGVALGTARGGDAGPKNFGMAWVDLAVEPEKKK